MSKTNCQTIQRELDEVMLGEDCSAEALTHLSGCRECREFYDKQTKLRQIVGSLGTVSAPADFDFRLRSRLARENSVSQFHSHRTVWSFGQRSVVATMALVVLFGVVMTVRYVSSRDEKPTTASYPAVRTPTTVQAGNEQAVKAVEPLDHNDSASPQSNVVVSNRPNRSGSKELSKTLSTVESASTRASVLRLDQLQETNEVFPIDAAEQSLKVSLFDSRGNPKTISVPTVSFGSKRVLPVSTQFAPKGSW